MSLSTAYRWRQYTAAPGVIIRQSARLATEGPGRPYDYWLHANEWRHDDVGEKPVLVDRGSRGTSLDMLHSIEDTMSPDVISPRVTCLLRENTAEQNSGTLNGELTRLIAQRLGLWLVIGRNINRWLFWWCELNVRKHWTQSLAEAASFSTWSRMELAYGLQRAAFNKKNWSY